MLKNKNYYRKLNRIFKHDMLCCGRKKGREATPDIATSPRRQNPSYENGTNNAMLRPKEHPPMVIQGDFRKVSGISNEVFRQIETIENEYDASTAAALEAVERRGEMIVRILDIKHLSKAAAEAAKKFFSLQDAKHNVILVEIIKRPGQTLGLYIREGNGLDRTDGVFISRIALESAVYNSGCIQVGDEILAVNLVDVTRMSIDDVVIIMSIPRRLVLSTRQVIGYAMTGTLGSGNYGTLSHVRPPEPKPPPVVVIKKDLSREEDFDDDDEDKHLPHTRNNISGERQQREKSRSQYTLDSNGDLGSDLYYNSRPESRYHQTSTLDRRIGGWTYAPQKNILDQHLNLKQTENLQSNFDRSYPKTLESLAEKVHPFCPGGSTLGRRTSETALSSKYSHGANRRLGMTRSGSDQHLPRTEYENFSRTLPSRQSHTLIRSNFQTGSTVAGCNRQYSGGHVLSSYNSLAKRHNIDYVSDTEASYPTISKSSSYYYCRPNTTQTISGISSSTLSRLTKSGALSRASSLRSNSLPRDNRITRNQLSALSTTNSNLKYETDAKVISDVLDQDDDATLSAPELPSNEKLKKHNLFSSNVFTSDEYRAWLSRTPSTSAIYDRLKSHREPLLLRQKNRFTFSAENLPEKTRQSEFLNYSKYHPSQFISADPASMIPLPSATITTLDRHTRTSSLRRIRHLQELENKHLGNRSITPDIQIDRSRVLEINTSEFHKYKMEKSHLSDEYPSVSGLLWIHLLAGRGLRATTTTTTNTTTTTTTSQLSGSGIGTRDLYCVLECDRIHKARTVVRNGDLVFDWDETFELDLFSNRELDFLVYSWDPQYRHKLCYKGSIHLSSLLNKSPIHQLALKVEPRGTLYIRLRHTSAFQTYLRKPSKPVLSARSILTTNSLFGVDLETVVSRESDSITVSMQNLPQAPLVASVPIIIRRCIEEIEKRGLDITGLYRLCGSATKKRILREAFERNPRIIDLSSDNVPDVNVITGVFKDYLRELPESLFTKHLYQMIVNALSVCMSDDPQGNAKLIFSLLDCLSRVKKATLIFIMDHLSLVVSQSFNNKMSPQNLSIIFAPLLMIQSESEDKEIDFNQPTNILRYLLEVWPSKSVREIIIGPEKTSAAHTARPPPLPKKPSVVSVHGGGPLPIPSKGIRKPPPAVPARFTQVMFASPIVENLSNGSVAQTDSHVGTLKRKNQHCNNTINGCSVFEEKHNTNEISNTSQPLLQPLRVFSKFSSSSYQNRAETLMDGNYLPCNNKNDVYSNMGITLPSSPDTNLKSYSKIGYSSKQKDIPINVTLTTTSLSSSSSSSSSSSFSAKIQSNTHSKFDEFELVKDKYCSSKPGTGYSLQPISHNNNYSGSPPVLSLSSKSLPYKTNSVKIEEALKQISNNSKPMPSAFGHSRVEKSSNSIGESITKLDTGPWDSIVDSWIKENECPSSDTFFSSVHESFARSHKNPFLADLNLNTENTTVETNSFCKTSFTNSFSFCVDSPPSTSVSNGSATGSTNSDSTVTVLKNDTCTKQYDTECKNHTDDGAVDAITNTEIINEKQVNITDVLKKSSNESSS